MQRLKAQSANTLIEVVILLPLFLVGVFFVLWLSYVVNVRVNLQTAVENAVRLAGTRGKSALFDGEPTLGDSKHGALVPLDLLHSNGTLSQQNKHLLAWNVEDDYMQVYNERVARVFSGPDFHSLGLQIDELRDLPPQYSYAIAYTAKAMRMMVGDRIRYPCDPRDSNDPQNGEYCLLCRPVDPASTQEVQAQLPANNTPESFLSQVIALRCDYKPGGLLARPLLAMLNILGAGGGGVDNDTVLSHYSYFDSYEGCYRQIEDGVGKYCCENESGNVTYCI